MPSSLLTVYAVLVLSESESAPLFRSRLPATLPAEPMDKVPLTLVVPAPEIALFKVPVVNNVPA